jgi:hypothetical protein
MQSQATFQPLPDRAVERLFARFAAMYGDAAMKRMWGQQNAEAVKGIWADSLGRFSVDQILVGLRELEVSGVTFPPTLPEFVDTCRRSGSGPENVRLLPPKERTAEEIAAGRAMAERVTQAVHDGRRGRDPAEWAYRVIARYRSGDKVVADCSYRFALEALKNLGREIPA